MKRRNILAGRRQKLEAAGIIAAEAEDTDGRRVNYRLTKKGIDLAPVLLLGAAQIAKYNCLPAVSDGGRAEN